ncbi:MAG: hypothetical protein ACHBN1_23615 [Heteroscytonema crispum UTEX LB 1556]
MLAINRTLNKMRRQIATIMLAGLVWLISLPVTSAQAEGYFGEKNHNVQATAKNLKNLPDTSGDDYIESGKRAAEVIPKDLGTGSRQKNPIDMLKRAGEEVGNNPLKRGFGAKDYDKSEIEEELARNKAARGDSDAPGNAKIQGY